MQLILGFFQLGDKQISYIQKILWEGAFCWDYALYEFMKK